MFKKLWYFFLDSLQALVFAFSIFALTYFFIAQPNKVKGHSMMPAFHNSDLLLTEKISYHFHPPQRGDVVIFKAPPSEPCAIDQCEYIKRIIGLPGETVELHQGHVYINNHLLREPYLSPNVATMAEELLREDMPLVIPAGHYLVFGDNRPHSRDSRAFGPISATRIVGRAIFRYWPPNRIQIIKRPFYNLANLPDR